MRVHRYTSADQSEWDRFVRSSKNGTFLLERGYTEYHADRFRDHSLLVRDDNFRLVAVVPGHESGAEYASHGGLTYGGLITNEDAKSPEVLAAFDAAATYLHANGFRRWTYKTIPTIYHRYPAEEDRYALFLAGAEVSRCDLFTAVDLQHRLGYQERRKRGVKKAAATGVTVRDDADLTEYWEVLTDTLGRRHEAAPVHTLEEITRLRTAFPANIRLVTAHGADRTMLAGVVVFVGPRVARSQYIAATDAGRNCGALDAVFDALLTRSFTEQRYFDFGGSNEDAGRRLNRGLIEQKEGFGARAVAHLHYTIDLTGWRPGRVTEALK